jgi:uncharacterized protein YjeT (DUF2065 family)
LYENLFFATVALVFIFEGILPFVFPQFWKKMMTQAVEQDEKSLRTMGFISITIGMIILYILETFAP